jgi:hypothetical protein
MGITWLVYDKLWVVNHNTSYLTLLQSKFHGGNIVLFVVCIFLAPFNWLAEIIKWRSLTAPFQQLKWYEASQAILAGIMLGILSPSRIGEYGGRLLHIKEGSRAKALYAHFMGSLSQNIPIIVFGSLSSMLFFTNNYIHNAFISVSLGLIILSLGILLLLLYFQNDGLLQKLNSIKLFQKYFSKFSLTQYETNVLHHVAFCSILRYTIYVSQYVLLIYFFDINVDLIHAIMGVSIIYLFQSGLPLPPALSIIARTELALIVWQVYDAQNQISILAVPIILYIINLLLPSIFGAIIIISSNVHKQISNV